MRPLWSLPFLIFPLRCPLCGGLTAIKEPLCKDCLQGLRNPISTPRCALCGIKLQFGTDRRCLGCLKNPPVVDALTVYTDYTGKARKLIHLIKFRANRRLALLAGRLLSELPIPFADAIVPVPLSKRRLIQRGFNQSQVMAGAISEKTAIPVKNLLVRTKDTPPQSGLGRKERLKNIKGAFSLNDRDGLPRSVIVVDDVFTTGATVNEVARVLKKAGVHTVSALVFARTPED